MTSKSDKGKKSAEKIDKPSVDSTERKASSKSKKQMADDDEDDEMNDEEMELKTSLKKRGKSCGI